MFWTVFRRPCWRVFWHFSCVTRDVTYGPTLVLVNSVILSGIYFDILSDTLFGVHSGILSCIYFGNLSGIHSGTVSGRTAGSLFGTLSGVSSATTLT